LVGERLAQPVATSAVASGVRRTTKDDERGGVACVQWLLEHREIALVLEPDAGQPPLQGLTHQPCQLERGGLVRQALGPHVRDAVALGIVQAALRRMGQVDAQAVRRAQARPLADQHDREHGAEQLAHLVGQRHARLRGNDHGREARLGGQVRAQYREQRCGMARHRERGQPVADDDADVAAVAPDAAQAAAVFLVELAAQVGAAQVGGAVGGAAAGTGHVPVLRAQGGFERIDVERRMDRVARHRMGPAEAQCFVGRHAGTGAAQRKASGQWPSAIAPRGWG
jgi:hypothetical protein